MNNYYDVQLKHDRLKQLDSHKNFVFVKMDVADRSAMATLFEKEKFNRVINLGAQAGVRYPLRNPPMQDGDVMATYADIASLREAVGFKPSTSLKEGITKFSQWYKTYHGF